MIKMVIASDFCPHSRLTKLVNEKKYKVVFGNVGPLIKTVNYSMGNIESLCHRRG
jgi:hypothetical protein